MLNYGFSFLLLRIKVTLGMTNNFIGSYEPIDWMEEDGFCFSCPTLDPIPQGGVSV